MSSPSHLDLNEDYCLGSSLIGFTYRTTLVSRLPTLLLCRSPFRCKREQIRFSLVGAPQAITLLRVPSFSRKCSKTCIKTLVAARIICIQFSLLPTHVLFQSLSKASLRSSLFVSAFTFFQPTTEPAVSGFHAIRTDLPLTAALSPVSSTSLVYRLPTSYIYRLYMRRYVPNLFSIDKLP